VPWHGFCGFAAALVRLRAESCGIGEALGGACGPALDKSLADVRARIRLLVERAQQAGVMRPGVAWQDVPFLLAAAATRPGTVSACRRATCSGNATCRSSSTGCVRPSQARCRVPRRAPSLR